MASTWAPLMVYRSLIKETVSFLHIHLNPIHLKYTYISKLPDFVGVQQLHSSCAFVEVIFLLSSESETLVSNDFQILALFLQVVSAFNFEHLQTEKNRERLGALLKKLYFYPQNVS